jgi:serine protease Do
VEKGGAADKAGIEVSDVILEFDGKAVNSASDLPRIVAATKPGSSVTVELWRKGAAKQVSVVIAKMADEKVLAQESRKHPDELGETISRLGLVVSELTAEQSQELQVSGGLLIQDVKGSAARAAGLNRGDVVLAIGNVPIRSLKQFNQVLKQVPQGRNVALLIRRGEVVSYIAIKLDEKSARIRALRKRRIRRDFYLEPHAANT